MCTPPQGQELTNNTVRELSQEHKVVHEFTTECHFQARRDYETMARSWWGYNGSGVGRGVRGSEVLVPEFHTSSGKKCCEVMSAVSESRIKLKNLRGT